MGSWGLHMGFGPVKGEIRWAEIGGFGQSYGFKGREFESDDFQFEAHMHPIRKKDSCRCMGIVQLVSKNKA